MNNSILRRVRGRLGKVRRQLRSRPTRTLRQRELILRDTTLTVAERVLLEQIDTNISPNDGMYVGNGDHYYRVGLSAIYCIERAMQAANISRVRNALDLPCGHGRVLRFLVKRFPETRFTACDLDRDGVDFCAATWDVDSAYSRVELDGFSLGRQFDLIWCGSLITHLDDLKIASLLDFFARHLSSGGLLVFTAAGDRVAQWMVSGEFDYGIDRGKIPKLLQTYQTTGYGYTDYPYMPDYGISLTSCDWIRNEIRKLDGMQTVSQGTVEQPNAATRANKLPPIGALKEIYFQPHEWDNHQDVYGYVKL